MKTVREQIRELLERVVGLFARSRSQGTMEHTPVPQQEAPASTEPELPDRQELQLPDQIETGLSDQMMEREDSETWQATQVLLRELRDLMAAEYGEAKEEDSAPERRRPGRPRQGDSGQLPPIEERVQSVGALFSEMTKKPKSEMVVLITYDITSNKIRKKVSDYLEGIGCERIQKSVFLGQIDKRSFREIQETVYALQQSYENEDSIVFLPVSESELMGMRMVGKEIDMTFALKRQNTLFF